MSMIEEWAAAHNITMRVEPGWEGPASVGVEGMDAWTVLLKRQAKGDTVRVLVPFYMGKGYQGRPPTIGEVLECLVFDATSVEGLDYDAWVKSLGWEDSRDTLDAYWACVRIGEHLKRLLGEELLADLKRLVEES